MDAAPDIDAVAGESVVVIGGGFGGLSTACYLADAGADVTVLEKNDQLGGRASRLEADGFRFDMGPSWYLMPDVFERFFGHFDRSPEEYYTLSRLDPHYRVFWKDGDRVDVLPDMEHNRELFESYEPGAADALDAYLEESKRTYEIGMEHFVYEDRPRLRDYIDTDVLRYSWGLSLLGKMQGHVEGYFDHPKLQQLMQYTLVFLGGSPTNTPALYNLMSHVDFNMGVYYPDGGIGAVVDGIVELAGELGVEFVTGAEVTGIEGRYGAFAVDTVDGDRHLADLVVSNADYAHTEQSLLPEQKRQYTEEYWESRTFARSLPRRFSSTWVSKATSTSSHITPSCCRQNGTSTSRRSSTTPPGPMIRRTTCVCRRRPTTRSHRTATATSSRSFLLHPGSKIRPRSARSTATSCSTTSKHILERHCTTGSCSKKCSASRTLLTATTATTEARWVSLTRSDRHRCCDHRTALMRSMGSISPAARRPPASASRCV